MEAINTHLGGGGNPTLVSGTYDLSRAVPPVFGGRRPSGIDAVPSCDSVRFSVRLKATGGGFEAAVLRE